MMSDEPEKYIPAPTVSPYLSTDWLDWATEQLPRLQQIEKAAKAVMDSERPLPTVFSTTFTMITVSAYKDLAEALEQDDE
jgi:hypothetical protein